VCFLSHPKTICSDCLPRGLSVCAIHPAYMEKDTKPLYVLSLLPVSPKLSKRKDSGRSRCTGLYDMSHSKGRPSPTTCAQLTLEPDEMRWCRGRAKAVPALQARKRRVRSSINPFSTPIIMLGRCIFEKHRRGRKPGSKSVFAVTRSRRLITSTIGFLQVRSFSEKWRKVYETQRSHCTSTTHSYPTVPCHTAENCIPNTSPASYHH
jgi:hypothetical protein